MTRTETMLHKALKAIPAKHAHAHNKMLLRKLIEHIGDADADHFSPELLGDIIQIHGEMAQKRTSGIAQIKIRTVTNETEGNSGRMTTIDFVGDDYAFLVDSIAAEINNNDFLIDLLVHPILYSQYDDNDTLTDVSDEPKEGYIQQSHIHIQIKDTPPQEALDRLENGLHEIVKDVQLTNRDWPQMLECLAQAREDLANAKTRRPLSEVQQYCDFLDYLHKNNFTLLGYREYEFIQKNGELKSRTKKKSSLGLLHNEIRPAYISDCEEGLPRNLQEKRKNLAPLTISKTNRLSTVHRRVPMDAIAIKTYDADGNVKGEKLFLGLFTSVTYSRSVSDVPYLREKVQQVIELSGTIPDSHNRKALGHILEKYPRDELFQMEPSQLLEIATSIMRLQERQRIALYIRKDPFKRYISCLVYIPRDRFGTTLRKKMCAILEDELKGKCVNFSTSLDDSVFARVMFIINIKQSEEPKFDTDKLEKKLQEAGQTWQELLSAALAEHYQDEGYITEKAVKYGDAFPISYTTRYQAYQAVFDISKIEDALRTKALQLDLYKTEKCSEHQLRLKVYTCGKPLNLSDVMPILGHLGLKAISEYPFEIRPDGDFDSVWMHDFLLETAEENAPLNISEIKENFETGFVKIWDKQTENDSLGRLIPVANMTWHEVGILRTYVRYLKQIRFPLSRPYIEKTLNGHADISRMIVDLFLTYHDPSLKDGEKKAEAIKANIEKALEHVESLDQDRIIRTITALVEATLRSNYFQTNDNGDKKSWLSMKFDCSKVPDMPQPRPYREIFVYSPKVEGVHLRGDKIARGGLRWSDRHDDFRTEVLGLMKAQMVKNSVIVPMGAKGGFVVKKATKTRDEFMAEGIECYKTFIRGLLDITDNRKGTKIVPPKNVKRRDGDDPYLVVAADKGTASFSDIANSLSQEYKFWLDDAFASGGSAGYDHKKMGITARGAWESVKLLFREMGHNTQEEPFDAVGVGDMGGDVFGNGMLLSKHIRLIGAFNHLHIFVDPNPDPAESWKERKRLFDNVKGWNEYNTKKLSKGGRIYDRHEKSLTLTPEIKERFDIDKDKVTPNELMRAILSAQTDLLWFGGIGTYIKATSETHADAGDKANDSIRLNASKIRAKVIGEGANLGTTQLGRIEFSKNGGLINTDFVDNSGGVNSSDLEVNIKILLSDVMSEQKHKMDIDVRNKLLEKMTDNVADLVLRNNYQQAQAISLASVNAKHNLQVHNDFIRELEREKGLSRALEGLPDEEAIEKRLTSGKGLTRPELCILLSYAKIGFTQDLLDSDIPDSPDMREWLISYFPDDLQEKYKEEILRHRLAKEIVATQMANSLVNRMGPTFLKEKMNKTGASVEQIAKAYLIVRDAFGLKSLWDSIEDLDNKVPAAVQFKAMHQIAKLSEHSISWFLTRYTGKLDIGREIKHFTADIQTIKECLPKRLPEELLNEVKARTEENIQDGLPKKLANEIALLPLLSSACDIIRISKDKNTDILETAQTYFEVGEKFQIYWLRSQALTLPTNTPWQYEASNGIIEQLYNAQAIITKRILTDISKPDKDTKSYTQSWVDSNPEHMQKLSSLFGALHKTAALDLAMLVTAQQRLNNLSAS